MLIHAELHSSKKGETLPLIPVTLDSPSHLLQTPLPVECCPPVGCRVILSGENLFMITDYVWIPVTGRRILCPMLESLRETRQEKATLEIVKKGLSLATVTLSDKGSAGLREDESGPAITELINTSTLEADYSQSWIIPDEMPLLRGLMAQLALVCKYDLIITTGGTGVGERDITPQAIRPLLDYDLPGFTIAMLTESMKKTPHGIISRPLCGVIGKALVLTLPGSPKAVRENLSAVLPALNHALRKIHGDKSDCGVK